MLVAACCPFDYFVLEHFIFLSVDGHLQGIAKPLFMLDSRHEPEGLNLNYSPKPSKSINPKNNKSTT